MNKIKRSYGICIQPCEILNRNSNKCENLRQGDLLRILESGCIGTDKIIIKLYNFIENNFKTDLFECPKQNTDVIEENLYFYMIGTKENRVRIEIYNESSLVLGLKCGHEFILNSFENDFNANIKVLVQFIGAVKDLGNGNFVGVKILTPPTNRQTFDNLYKKHFHQSTSLFLFRIEELLNAIKITHQHILKNSKEYYATQFHIQQQNNIASAIPLVLSRNSSTKESSNFPITTSHLYMDPFANQLATNSGTNRAYYVRPNSQPLYEPSNYTGPISNYVPRSSHNWQTTAIPSNDLAFQVPIDYSNLNHNTKTFEIPANENSKLINVAKNENDNGNNSRRPNIRRNRNDRSRKGNSEYRGACQKCKNNKIHRFQLKCNHFICGKCLNINGKHRIKCPFISSSKVECKYSLKDDEIEAIHRKLNVVQQPESENDSSTSEEEEEVFECQSDRCEGKWFISKTSSANLYRCPLCNESNCVACKAIHDNMTCKDYKKSIKGLEKPKVYQQLADCLSKLVKITFEGAGAESQNIPAKASSPEGNEEILMKCKTKNCTGQWFKSKNDKNSIFKCPTCQAFNCSICNAQHENQTCFEYQGARQKYVPNFLRTKNPEIQPPPVQHFRHPVAEPADNPLKKRKWNCTFCTFENFSFGYICQICQQNNLEG